MRLHRPGAGLPLPSMAIHDGVYSTLEDGYRDRERAEMGGMRPGGGRFAMPPSHPHMNTRLVIPNNISGNSQCGSRQYTVQYLLVSLVALVLSPFYFLCMMDAKSY